MNEANLIKEEVDKIVAANLTRNPQLMQHIKDGDEKFLKGYCAGVVTQFLARNPSFYLSKP